MAPKRKKRTEEIKKSKKFKVDAISSEESGSEDEEVYEVEKILDRMISEEGELYFKVKWKGFSDTDSTWEPISNLESAHDKIQEFEQTREGEYIVEAIRSKRKQNGKIEYKVKWIGYPESQNTWEPEVNILDKNLIADFERRIQKSKGTAKKNVQPSKGKKKEEMPEVEIPPQVKFIRDLPYASQWEILRRISPIGTIPIKKLTSEIQLKIEKAKHHLEVGEIMQSLHSLPPTANVEDASFFQNLKFSSSLHRFTPEDLISNTLHRSHSAVTKTKHVDLHFSIFFYRSNSVVKYSLLPIELIPSSSLGREIGSENLLTVYFSEDLRSSDLSQLVSTKFELPHIAASFEFLCGYPFERKAYFLRISATSKQRASSYIETHFPIGSTATTRTTSENLLISNHLNLHVSPSIGDVQISHDQIRLTRQQFIVDTIPPKSSTVGVSDGFAFINKRTMDFIASALSLPFNPSVIQATLIDSNVKGIWVLKDCKVSTVDTDPIELTVTSKQRSFPRHPIPEHDDTLSLLSFSSPSISSFLTPPILSVLTSRYQLPQKVFIRLLEQSMRSQIQRLTTSPSQSLSYLLRHHSTLPDGFATDAIQMLLAGFDFSEPWLRQLLTNIIFVNFLHLKSSFLIPVDRSRRLFVIPDLMNLLNRPNDVYVHISNSTNGSASAPSIGVLSGSLLVAFHPSSTGQHNSNNNKNSNNNHHHHSSNHKNRNYDVDVRICNAIHVPGYTHLHDCLVVPNQLYREIATERSPFVFVSWESSLFPVDENGEVIRSIDEVMMMKDNEESEEDEDEQDDILMEGGNNISRSSRSARNSIKKQEDNDVIDVSSPLPAIRSKFVTELESGEYSFVLTELDKKVITDIFDCVVIPSLFDKLHGVWWLDSSKSAPNSGLRLDNDMILTISDEIEEKAQLIRKDFKKKFSNILSTNFSEEQKAEQCGKLETEVRDFFDSACEDERDMMRLASAIYKVTRKVDIQKQQKARTLPWIVCFGRLMRLKADATNKRECNSGQETIAPTILRTYFNELKM